MRENPQYARKKTNYYLLRLVLKQTKYYITCDLPHLPFFVYHKFAPFIKTEAMEMCL